MFSQDIKASKYISLKIQIWQQSFNPTSFYLKGIQVFKYTSL